MNAVAYVFVIHFVENESSIFYFDVLSRILFRCFFFCIILISSFSSLRLVFTAAAAATGAAAVVVVCSRQDK